MRLFVVAGLVACGRAGFDARPDARLDAAGPVGNRAFVTSTVQVPGMLGGSAGADAVCAARATAAGLDGTFIAYVSTTAEGAADRLRVARGWTRTDGKPVVDTVDDLLAGRMIYPIRLDELGTDLGGDNTYLVMTGTYVGMLNNNCADFTDPAELGMAGLQSFTASTFANVNTVTCDTPARLYCFQIDHQIPLAIEPERAGRKAFVSTGTFTPSTGIATADAMCASEAADANLPGSYRALLPTTAPAADRFDATGLAWGRVDGVPVAASASEFLAGHSTVPLRIHADGSATLDEYVQTGLRAESAFVVPDPTDTCDTWTSSASGSVYGFASSTDHASLNITTAACVEAHPVYCLEQ